MFASVADFTLIERITINQELMVIDYSLLEKTTTILYNFSSDGLQIDILFLLID